MKVVFGKIMSFTLMAVLIVTCINFTSLNEDISFAASKKSKKFKVSFNANGGKFVKQKVKTKKKTVKKKLKSKKVKVGKRYGTLAKVKRTGYEFKGWYTKKKGAKKVTPKTIVKKKKAHKLFARWEKKIYLNTQLVTRAGQPFNSIKSNYKDFVLKEKNIDSETCYYSPSNPDAYYWFRSKNPVNETNKFLSSCHVFNTTVKHIITNYSGKMDPNTLFKKIGATDAKFYYSSWMFRYKDVYEISIITGSQNAKITPDTKVEVFNFNFNTGV